MLPLHTSQRFKELHTSESIENLRGIIQRICGWDDADAPGRDMWITAIPGAYESAAGFIITINGSPPRGCLLVLGSHEYHVYFNAERRGGAMQRCRPEDGRAVLEFLASNGFDFGRPIAIEAAVCRWRSKEPACRSAAQQC